MKPFFYLLFFIIFLFEVDALSTTCSTCAECNTALNNNTYEQVNLTENITILVGNCIDNPVNFNNKIFDCQGFTIDGDYYIDWPLEYGIYLDNKENNTIKNCVSSGFEAGFYLYYSSNNILTNNTAISNQNSGFKLGYSSNNILTNNTAISNGNIGIHLEHSSNNILTNNTANSDVNYGIILYSYSNNNSIINSTANLNTYGICVHTTSNSNVIINNSINNNTIGIYIVDANDNNFSLNTAKFNFQHGFYSDITSTGNFIHNSSFCYNNQSGGDFYDIYDLNTTNNFTNNTCNTSNLNGKCVFSCDNCTEIPVVIWISVNQTNSSNPNPYLSFNMSSNVSQNMIFKVFVYDNATTLLTTENGSGPSNTNTTHHLIYSLPPTTNPTIYFFVIEATNNCQKKANSSNLTYFLVPPTTYLLSPSDEEIFVYGTTSINLSFYVIDPTHNYLNCSLYMDKILNQTNSSVVENQTTLFTINNLVSKEYNWNVTCINGADINCSNDRNFTIANYNLSGGVCECNSCSDCTNKLNSANCSQVNLTTNIINHSGTCINNPANFNNKIFDCQGYTIDGDDTGADYGIYLNAKTNNTIKNCIITDFERGFFLYYSSGNNLTNNSANSNTFAGIRVYYSPNNTLTNITANNNQYGIYLYSSTNNTITQNFVCKNAKWDILSNTNVFGNNNTCARVLKFRDNGYPLCKTMCEGEDPNYWWFLIFLPPAAYWYYNFHKRKKNGR